MLLQGATLIFNGRHLLRVLSKAQTLIVNATPCIRQSRPNNDDFHSLGHAKARPVSKPDKTSKENEEHEQGDTKVLDEDDMEDVVLIYRHYKCSQLYSS